MRAPTQQKSEVGTHHTDQVSGEKGRTGRGEDLKLENAQNNNSTKMLHNVKPKDMWDPGAYWNIMSQ